MAAGHCIGAGNDGIGCSSGGNQSRKLAKPEDCLGAGWSGSQQQHHKPDSILLSWPWPLHFLRPIKRAGIQGGPLVTRWPTRWLTV